MREHSFPDMHRTHTAATAEQAQLTRISERQRATVAPAIHRECAPSAHNSKFGGAGTHVHQEPIENTGAERYEEETIIST